MHSSPSQVIESKLHTQSTRTYVAKVMADVGEGSRVPINAMVIKASSIHEARTLASLDYGKTHPHTNLADLAIEVSEVESKQLTTSS